MPVWRVLLRLSTQPYEPSGYAAMNATFFDRENASKHDTIGRITAFRHSRRRFTDTVTQTDLDT